ncbi:hypothetical protein [Caballeronia glebae]|uniref:hypothetical protein n=1 Tax=Caballeronia glebae TaxID=1777143 RepID=UPI0038B7716B
MKKDTPVADQLKAAKAKWDEMKAGLPPTVQVQNNVSVTPDVITEWFAFCVNGVFMVESGSQDAGMMAIHWVNVVNAVQQVGSYMSTAGQNGAPWLAQTCSTLHAYLWSTRSSLTWLLPPSLGGEEAQFPRLKEILANADLIVALTKRAVNESEQITHSLTQAETVREKALETVEKINGYERSASNAQTMATASAATAESERQRVDQQVVELSGASEKQKALFEEFENYREIVEGTIQGASKVALAKSFQSRREGLARSQRNWAWVFGFGIVALCGSGFAIAHEVLSTMQSNAAGLSALTASVASSGASSTSAESAASAASALNQVAASSLKSDILSVAGLLLRFVVVSPIIWLTWFAARQYGHCLRLGEDYAFKEAAAHAFVGYRSEMGDDPEMIKLLREYAIKNFGANPTRVLSKSEPVTPLSDVFEHAFEKVNPDKLIDMLKEAISSAKK